MTCVLVLATDRRLPVPDVGRAVARALRRPLADVTRALRESRGVLDLDLDEGEAAVVVEVFETMGIRARPIPSSELPPLPEPHPLVDADPVAAGLDVQLVAGTDLGLVPWDRLGLVTVGLVTFETPAGGALASGRGDATEIIEAALTGMMLGYGLGPVAAGSLNREPPRGARPPRRELVHCLDLLLKEPAQRLRVIASRFVYDYLGDRLGLSSVPNFRTLVEDIARFAPETLLSGSTLSFLDGGKRDGAHRFGSQGEFEAYERWLLAWPAVFGE